MVGDDEGRDREVFQAPQWVQDDANPNLEKAQRYLTKKQKYLLSLTTVVVVAFCLWAGWFELARAQKGNWRAWVYSFEWPFFAGVSIYMWRRFMNDDPPKIPHP